MNKLNENKDVIIWVKVFLIKYIIYYLLILQINKDKLWFIYSSKKYL